MRRHCAFQEAAHGEVFVDRLPMHAGAAANQAPLAALGLWRITEARDAFIEQLPQDFGQLSTLATARR